MLDVTWKNFRNILPQLKDTLKSANFITIDTEFSCLNAAKKLENSLFDSPDERYAKLLTTVTQMIPVQFGLTAFLFNPDDNSYTSFVYTFSIFPRCFTFIDCKFLFQLSSMQFLNTYNFDFNKFSYGGISFLSRALEEQLRKRINDITLLDSNMNYEIDDNVETCTNIINGWIEDAKLGDKLLLTTIKKVESNLELKYFLHKELRQKYKKHLWTYEDQEGFKVMKVTAEKFGVLSKKFNLNEQLITDLIGFSEVVRFLIFLKKPIIGHNLLQDLMITIHHFERALPESYTAFKKLANSLFPTIYDTKCLSFDILRRIPYRERLSKNTLSNLYEYFKDGYGRHIAINSPLIELMETNEQEVSPHSAGWDSYCTGYVFIRMAHIHALQRYKDVRGKKFMASELLQANAIFKNSVNIIRGDLSHIQLDGDDPISRRPPRLIIQAKNKTSFNEVLSLLATFRCVDVKPCLSREHSAIIAVDNFNSLNRILSQFDSNPDLKLLQYRILSRFDSYPYPLNHSPASKAVLWSGILASAILVWFGYRKIK